jgi:hypothetical protein
MGLGAPLLKGKSGRERNRKSKKAMPLNGDNTETRASVMRISSFGIEPRLVFSLLSHCTDEGIKRGNDEGKQPPHMSSFATLGRPLIKVTNVDMRVVVCSWLVMAKKTS